LLSALPAAGKGGRKPGSSQRARIAADVAERDRATGHQAETVMTRVFEK